MDIVTFGEILIDMFPAEVGRRLVEVSAFHPKPGGAPANVAVAARRLGAQAAFIGKVGEDLFGHHLMDILAGEGVNVRGMRYDQIARTTMAIIAMPDVNHAEFVFYRNPGADLQLEQSELDLDLLTHTRAFHFGSLSLVAEPARSTTQTAIQIAKSGGALISFDVNYRPSLWDEPARAIEQVHSVLPFVDLLKLNEVEMHLLTQQTHPFDAGFALLEQGPRLVAITLGQKGSYYICKEVQGFTPAFHVPTVDSTGCGDAFIAGLLYQLTCKDVWQSELQETSIEQAFRYASAVGALTATRQGVIPALPTSSQVEQFLHIQTQ